MRKKRSVQMCISEILVNHKIGCELQSISEWLDAHTEVLDWVEADIQRVNLRETGRSGLTIGSIVRAGILLRYRQWTYEELAFNLMDSEVSYGFTRLPRGLYPKVSALQGTIMPAVKMLLRPKHSGSRKWDCPKRGG